MDRLRSFLPKNPGYIYHAVGGNQQSTVPSLNGGQSPFATGRGRTFLAFAFSLVLLIFYMIAPSGQNEPTRPPPNTRPANFHLLIPASKTDPNLCRLLASAGILGYPTAVMINYEGETDHTPAEVAQQPSRYRNMGSYDAYAAKIKGVADYINHLDYAHDEDLVLLVDDYNVLLQLRPQTILDRYFESGNRAARRLKSEFGDLAEKHDMRQRIAFIGQADCAPWSETDAACYTAPRTSLMTDIVGKKTASTLYGMKKSRFQFHQPYLNAGVVVGHYKSLRIFINQAMKEIREGTNLGSNQDMFSHIYAEQELWREMVRRDQLKIWGGIKGDSDRKYRNQFTKKWNPEQIEAMRAKANGREEQNFEFGIGVDHLGELGLAHDLASTSTDVDWLTFTNKTQTARLVADVTVDQKHAAILSSDITKTLPPFWTFSFEKTLPRWRKWEDVPLLTQLRTGVVPAALYLTPKKDSNNPWNTLWASKPWSQMWFQNHTRALYDSHVYNPVVATAFAGPSPAERKAYWPYETWKGGAKTENASWAMYDYTCRDFHEEVWRDGRGEWHLPDNH